MGCKPSCICNAPEAVAPVTAQIPADANPSPVQGGTAVAPHSAVAPVATVSEPVPHAQLPSSAVIEGMVIKTEQQKLIHTARVR
jgi:hypothetical protein